MRLMGKAYDDRLAGFSRSTLELMATIMPYSREILFEMHSITTDSELTEEQIVEKLLELKKKVK